MSVKIPSWLEFHSKHPEISKLKYDAMVRKASKAKSEAERAGKPRKGNELTGMLPARQRIKGSKPRK